MLNMSPNLLFFSRKKKGGVAPCQLLRPPRFPPAWQELRTVYSLSPDPNLGPLPLSDHQKLEREARICRLLKHPNIGKCTRLRTLRVPGKEPGKSTSAPCPAPLPTCSPVLPPGLGDPQIQPCLQQHRLFVLPLRSGYHPRDGEGSRQQPALLTCRAVPPLPHGSQHLQMGSGEERPPPSGGGIEVGPT